MCGFFAIVYNKRNPQLGNILKRAGDKLSYRGYDSTGIAVFEKDGKYGIYKDKGHVDDVARRLGFSNYGGYKGIIQLRWATYGKPSKRNSQPHSDCTGEYVAAHNGNIINVHHLFRELTEEGHSIRSKNDGEVVVHIMEEGLKTMDLNDAVRYTYERIKGDYAYCFTDRNNGHITAVKKGSSLFAGIGKDFICVSSDYYAILDHTHRIVFLNDGEMINFSHNHFTVSDIVTGNKKRRRITKNNIDAEIIEKEPYDSFMEKEISEVPLKLETLKEYYLSTRNLSKLRKILSSSHLNITGSGTSYNAAFLGTYFMNRIAGLDVGTYLPSEISDRLRYINKHNSNLMVVTQSGETKDIKNAIDVFRSYSNGKIIGMINNLGSSIAVMSDFVLPTISDMEISVPATKTFINQITLFYIISLYMSGMKMKDIDSKLDILIKYISSVKREDSSIRMFADKLTGKRNMHILGYSLTYPVALESALKMKEVNYKHIEAMHSSEFKHGPLALISRDYPVILITTARDKHYTLSHINEIQTRKGQIFCISQPDEDLSNNADFTLEIDIDDENLFAIAAAYVMQTVALQIAYNKGIDPDKPKNISKTITVD